MTWAMELAEARRFREPPVVETVAAMPLMLPMLPVFPVLPVLLPPVGA